jgi:hypothetical protein
MISRKVVSLLTFLILSSIICQNTTNTTSAANTTASTNTTAATNTTSTTNTTAPNSSSSTPVQNKCAITNLNGKGPASLQDCLADKSIASGLSCCFLSAYWGSGNITGIYTMCDLAKTSDYQTMNNTYWKNGVIQAYLTPYGLTYKDYQCNTCSLSYSFVAVFILALLF